MEKKTYTIIGAVAVLFAVTMVTLNYTTHVFDSRKEIRFWQFWNPQWIAPAVQKFEETHPEYRVTIEQLTWEEGRNKIITALAADDAPDIIEIGSTWVAGFGKDGGLVEIVRGDTENTLSNWSSAYFNGKYYAYPWVLSTNAVFYNKKLLKDAGIETPPANWTELLNAVIKIHKPDAGIYGYGLKTGKQTTWQKFLPYAWSNGAQMITEDWKNTDITGTDFIDALKFYKTLKNYGFYDENVNVRKSFQEGKIGFMQEDPGQIAKFRKETPELEFGVIMLPASPKGMVKNFAGAEMLAVTKNAKYPEMAMEFIRFMLQPENTMLITKKITTLFPAHKDAVKDPFYTNADAEIQLFLKSMEQAVSPPAHPEWERIQEILSEGIDKVLMDKQAPEDAMQEAKDKIQPLLDTAL